MEQFSLEKYLANPSRKVVTGDGRNARIICTDRRDIGRLIEHPIVALVETDFKGKEITAYYTREGRYADDNISKYDLFFAPEKHEGWINIYRSEYEDYYQGKIIYSSKEDAIKRGEKTPYYITTTKIEWEE